MEISALTREGLLVMPVNEGAIHRLILSSIGWGCNIENSEAPEGFAGCKFASIYACGWCARLVWGITAHVL